MASTGPASAGAGRARAKSAAAGSRRTPPSTASRPALSPSRDRPQSRARGGSSARLSSAPGRRKVATVSPQAARRSSAEIARNASPPSRSAATSRPSDSGLQRAAL